MLTRVIADPEDVIPSAVNSAERERRMQFYQRSGFENSSVRYLWRGESYVIFVCSGAFTDEALDAFWHHFSIQPQRPEVNPT